MDKEPNVRSHVGREDRFDSSTVRMNVHHANDKPWPHLYRGYKPLDAACNMAAGAVARACVTGLDDSKLGQV